MAHAIADELQSLDATVSFHDLRDHELEFCGLPSARQAPIVDELRAEIQEAQAILMSTPIYNFYVNAAAKNLVELTGRAWENKLVGFMCAAGGRASYMSVMNIANSLMLDFRCLIIPRFVYAKGGDFENDRTEEMAIGPGDLKDRLQGLAQVTVDLGRAVDPVLTGLSS
jgi:NAD(P)H-dependent FMN reductase